MIQMAPAAGRKCSSAAARSMPAPRNVATPKLNGSTPDGGWKTAGVIHMYWVRNTMHQITTFWPMLLYRTMMGQAMALMTEIEVLLSEGTYEIPTLVILRMMRIQKCKSHSLVSHVDLTP